MAGASTLPLRILKLSYSFYYCTKYKNKQVSAQRIPLQSLSEKRDSWVAYDYNYSSSNILGVHIFLISMFIFKIFQAFPHNYQDRYILYDTSFYQK